MSPLLSLPTKRRPSGAKVMAAGRPLACESSFYPVAKTSIAPFDTFGRVLPGRGNPLPGSTSTTMRRASAHDP